MATSLIPASQGSVIVSDPVVIALMTVPEEVTGDTVELLNALDSSVVAQATKVGQYWRAEFAMTLSPSFIDLTARVKRGLVYSRTTLPTFRITYEPIVPTVTPSPTPVALCSSFIYEFDGALGINENSDMLANPIGNFIFRVYQNPIDQNNLGLETEVVIPSNTRKFGQVISLIKDQLVGFDCFFVAAGTKTNFVLSRPNAPFAVQDDYDTTDYALVRPNTFGLFKSDLYDSMFSGLAGTIYATPNPFGIVNPTGTCLIPRTPVPMVLTPLVDEIRLVNDYGVVASPTFERGDKRGLEGVFKGLNPNKLYDIRFIISHIGPYGLEENTIATATSINPQPDSTYSFYYSDVSILTFYLAVDVYKIFSRITTLNDLGDVIFVRESLPLEVEVIN